MRDYCVRPRAIEIVVRDTRPRRLVNLVDAVKDEDFSEVDAGVGEDLFDPRYSQSFADVEAWAR